MMKYKLFCNKVKKVTICFLFVVVFTNLSFGQFEKYMNNISKLYSSENYVFKFDSLRYDLVQNFDERYYVRKLFSNDFLNVVKKFDHLQLNHLLEKKIPEYIGVDEVPSSIRRKAVVAMNKCYGVYHSINRAGFDINLEKKFLVYLNSILYRLLPENVCTKYNIRIKVSNSFIFSYSSSTLSENGDILIDYSLVYQYG